MRALRRLLAALASFAPIVARRRWRWYRWAYGGRWSRSPIDLSWRAVANCPGALNSAFALGEGVQLGACFDEREVFEDGAAECNCEVWP